MLSDEELAAIRARQNEAAPALEYVKRGYSAIHPLGAEAMLDREALLAEVDRLREEVAGLRAAAVCDGCGREVDVRPALFYGCRDGSYVCESCLAERLG